MEKQAFSTLPNPVLDGIGEVMHRAVDELIRKEFADREKCVRRLLEHWVSELEPAIAIGPNNELLGLTWADYEVGTPNTFILRLSDVHD